jgi:uncharacterized membrane protein HdeD (DUF308 family)
LIQTLTKNWWLLGLCGVLDAIISGIYLIIYDTSPDIHGGNGMEVFLNRLALAAGACTIAASIWRSAKGKSWLLVLNGLALSAHGLMALFWRGPLSFRFFALLVVVMAMTFGILALAIARTLRGRVADEWLGWGGVDRFCFGVSRFGESLDSARTQAFSPFNFSLVLLLLWVQRNLHVGAGPAPAQPIPVPIRPVGNLTTRKSKTRALSSGLSTNVCMLLCIMCRHTRQPALK